MPERRGPAPEEVEDKDTVTNRKEKDLLSIYSEDLGKYKLLTSEEEIKLAKKAQKGDQEARNLLINSNLRLVVKMANKYAPHKNILPDLIQEGNLGLFKAIEKFNPDRKVRFATYATTWIKAYILRYLEYNKNPVKPGHTEEQRQNPNKFVSTDAPIFSSEDSPTFGDNLKSDYSSPEEEAQKNELAEATNEAINELSDKRDRDIVRGHLMGNLTLEQLGKKYGVSRERIRQLEVEIKKKLAEILEQKGIKDFE